MKIIFSPRAAADMDRLRGFLREYSASSAERAVIDILDGIRLLGSFPGVGKPLGRTGLRELIIPFGQSAYVVRYFRSQARDAVVIQRIWHGHEIRS